MADGTSRYGVFIASPGDVRDERDKAVDTVIEWNMHHWNEGVTFIPLTWEYGTVGDIHKTAQQAIDEQLRPKADFMVAIFGSRLGTEIEEGVTGTSHEITNSPEHTAVYFAKNQSVDPNDPQFDENVKQVQSLLAYKKDLQSKGYVKDFVNAEDFGKLFYQQLDSWADKAKPVLPTYSISSTTLDIIDWLNSVNSCQKKCCLLLYNIELNAMKTHELFEQQFADILQLEIVHRVVLLLPSFKIRRLAYYLRDFPKDYLQDNKLGKFSVGQIEASENGRYRRVTTGAAFGLLRCGTNPGSGKLSPGALFLGLTEPLSSPGKGVTADPEIIWDYNYPLFISGEEPIQHDLLDIWDEGFDEKSLSPLSEIAGSAKSEKPIEQQIKNMTISENMLSQDASLKLIKTLREKVFDPNVPSYLLDKHFFMLDWNPAFELVFPTSRFYRGEHIKEFVSCLTNVESVVDRGKKMEAGGVLSSFDIETLEYLSPIYGVMKFTKMASRIEDPETSEDLGWIIALNAAKVENPLRYENDLGTINTQQSLTTVYASPFDKIVSKYPGYQQLVELHAEAMSGASRVLDLGAGIGVLTLELLNRNKQVTAIDNNGIMLDLLRKRCRKFLANGLTVLKSNIQTLHSPNPDYDFSRIGISPPYNGATLLNVLHSLDRPEDTLRHLVEERLLSPGARIAFSAPGPNSDIDILLQDIQQKTEKCWSANEWRRFSGVNRKVDEIGDLGRFSEDCVSEMLDRVGYKLLQAVPAVYAGQGVFYVAEVRT
jgi:SAM-dependent methyltransferase